MEERIKELKKEIDQQRELNIALFSSIPLASHEDPLNKKAEPILVKWREGSARLKALLSELRELEMTKRTVQITKSLTKGNRNRMIRLNLLSQEQFNEKYYEKIGFRSDEAYEIILEDHNDIGIIMISNHNPHYDNACTFIEWVEINKQFRRESLFSHVISEIFSLYKTTEIHFECTDDELPMYFYLGADSTGISELTDNNMMILKKDNFENRKSRG